MILRRRLAMTLLTALAVGGCTQEKTKVQKEHEETQALIEAMKRNPTLEQAKRTGPENVVIAPAAKGGSGDHGSHSPEHGAAMANQHGH